MIQFLSLILIHCCLTRQSGFVVCSRMCGMTWSALFEFIVTLSSCQNFLGRGAVDHLYSESIDCLLNQSVVL